MESNQTAAREARRFLADRVRDDWDWPGTPAPWSHSDEEVRGVVNFKEREYGTTSGSDPDTAPVTNAGEDPYKFDSPDSVAVAVESKLDSRKRKRREMLAEEMAWNEGVACFVQRRDAWTGAAAVKKYGANKRSSPGQPESSDSKLGGPPASVGIQNGVHDSSDTPSTSQPVLHAETLVPRARPILPHNPIRGSISTKIYPDIYGKVVVSSRTPSVPINLSDMTRALVQGWKDNGEWPPKAGPLDPLPGGRRKLAALRSLSGKGDISKGDDAFLANHPHVKRGVDSVKKILRLSGSHSDVAPTGQGLPAADAG